MKSDSSTRINKIKAQQNATLAIKVINGDAKKVDRASHAVVTWTLPLTARVIPEGTLETPRPALLYNEYLLITSHIKIIEKERDLADLPVCFGRRAHTRGNT